MYNIMKNMNLSVLKSIMLGAVLAVLPAVSKGQNITLRQCLEKGLENN